MAISISGKVLERITVEALEEVKISIAGTQKMCLN